jgi:hypothetical protein
MLMRYKGRGVKTVRWTLLFGAMALCGCHTAHDVAVTSFHVIDAPANYVRRHIDQDSNTTATTSASSDTVTPGRSVQVAPDNRQSQAGATSSQTKPAPAATPRVQRETTTAEKTAASSPPPRNVTSAPAQVPTAKAVPGKPGYVFSPYDPNGGYVDVNGFTSGSKVKDPYSGKIFLVP